MKTYLLSLMAASFAWTNLALADSSGNPILSEGNYVTSGASHYLDGAVTLSAWNEDLVMTAILERDGRLYAVEAELTYSFGHRFDGYGKIIVTYENGGVCEHRFGMILYAHEDHVFIRDNMPGYIPYNPDGACSAASLYEWANHEEPYFLEQSVKASLGPIEL